MSSYDQSTKSKETRNTEDCNIEIINPIFETQAMEK